MSEWIKNKGLERGEESSAREGPCEERRAAIQKHSHDLFYEKLVKRGKIRREMISNGGKCLKYSNSKNGATGAVIHP